MELATWLSVIALGPGSIAIFCWFLWDVKRIFGGGRSDSSTDRDAGNPSAE
jgi:hypothetical protein